MNETIWKSDVENDSSYVEAIFCVTVLPQEGLHLCCAFTHSRGTVWAEITAWRRLYAFNGWAEGSCLFCFDELVYIYLDHLSTTRFTQNALIGLVKHRGDSNLMRMTPMMRMMTPMMVPTSIGCNTTYTSTDIYTDLKQPIKLASGYRSIPKYPKLQAIPTIPTSSQNAIPSLASLASLSAWAKFLTQYSRCAKHPRVLGRGSPSSQTAAFSGGSLRTLTPLERLSSQIGLTRWKHQQLFKALSIVSWWCTKTFWPVFDVRDISLDGVNRDDRSFGCRHKYTLQIWHIHAFLKSA